MSWSWPERTLAEVASTHRKHRATCAADHLVGYARAQVLGQGSCPLHTNYDHIHRLGGNFQDCLGGRTKLHHVLRLTPKLCLLRNEGAELLLGKSDYFASVKHRHSSGFRLR